MNINSNIIKSTDLIVKVSVYKYCSAVPPYQNRITLLAYLRSLIASEVFSSNCCIVNVTYKEKGKYKTEKIPSRCNSEEIVDKITPVIKKTDSIRVEITTTKDAPKVFVVLVV